MARPGDQRTNADLGFHSSSRSVALCCAPNMIALSCFLSLSCIHELHTKFVMAALELLSTPLFSTTVSTHCLEKLPLVVEHVFTRGNGTRIPQRLVARGGNLSICVESGMQQFKKLICLAL